ncbi:MAG: hypothetical protein HQL58_13190, partial [Magnetococcales bacterium]|nr:hypothetical protein [Magnetococcales bacterium]
MIMIGKDLLTDQHIRDAETFHDWVKRQIPVGIAVNDLDFSELSGDPVFINRLFERFSREILLTVVKDIDGLIELICATTVC